MSEILENDATNSEVTEAAAAPQGEARWYVAHTYSGYENKVKKDIENTIKNRKLQDQILEVFIPVQEVIETKTNGTKKTVQKKLIPGYVFVNMYHNEVTWYVVRNTRGVTGFVGPDPEKPTPLTEAEMRAMGIDVQLPTISTIDAKVGEMIKVITGAWEGSVGEIKAINDGKQTVTIEVDIFGRATSVEIGFTDIQKM